jgi:ATP-dependent protease HslVU (ClpYQ) ATPase subunit
MFEVFTDELFGQLDIDEFVKNEIESKAIVVIDEIDKLVRSVKRILFLITIG